MGLFGFLGSSTKTLIVADDMRGIWGIIADSKKIYTDNCFPRGTEFKKIAEFAKKQGATQVLFLRVSDVRELDVKLSSSLDDEERRSAIEYAAASNYGENAETQRISYLDGMLHDFRSGILTSFFDGDEILTLATTVKASKLKFLGVTNFKQLLMAAHFSDAKRHNEAFLFLLGNQGFVAVAEHNKLVVRNLPFGIPLEAEKEEWITKAQRRLSILKHKIVTVYANQELEWLGECIREFTSAEEVKFTDWQNALSEAAVYYLGYKKQRLIHPALPAPKPKDPKVAGTVVGIIMFGAVVVSLSGLMIKNYITQQMMNKEYTRAAEVLNNVKREETALKNLETSLKLEQELLLMMRKKERISKNFLLVVNLLSRYPLQYSRITQVREQSNGIFIEGETFWQPDLSKFSNHFEEELKKYNLNLFSDGLEKGDNGKIMFKAHVTGGAR